MLKLRKCTWITALLLGLLLAAPVLASDGTGGGGGKGGGTGGGTGSGETPLALEQSVPADGAQGVAVDTKIQMTFSKNVANMAVRDKNLTCFALKDSKGQAVPVTVEIADDQIEAEKKNDVVLAPQSPLAAGETYTVVIAPELTSKSGVSLGEAKQFAFTTAPVAADPAPTSAGVSNTLLLLGAAAAGIGAVAWLVLGRKKR